MSYPVRKLSGLNTKQPVEAYPHHIAVAGIYTRVFVKKVAGGFSEKLYDVKSSFITS